MPKSFVHISFLFLFLTALSGVWIRLIILEPSFSFTEYGFMLHAHSHMAILGWTFLAVFLIFLKIIWHDLKEKKEAATIVIATLLITLCMFVAFLYQGYALFSIIFSLAHIGIEYWMAIFMLRQIKNHTAIPIVIGRFLKGAIFALLISSIGPLSLGGIAMAGLKDAPIFEMAVYFYLHFQYNGWLYLILIGLFLFLLYRKNIQLNETLLNISFWIYFIALFPGFLLSILWYDLGIWANILGAVGAIGQFIGIIILLFAIIQQKWRLKKYFSDHIRISILFTFVLLLSKSLMEFGLLHEGLAALVFDTRAVIIGYLHLTFLGFISIFILTQYQIIGLINEVNKPVLYGVGIFILGFMVNEVVLFGMGLAGWLSYPIPFGNELLLFAASLLLIGILMIWSSLKKVTQ